MDWKISKTACDRCRSLNGANQSIKTHLVFYVPESHRIAECPHFSDFDSFYKLHCNIYNETEPPWEKFPCECFIMGLWKSWPIKRGGLWENERCLHPHLWTSDPKAICSLQRLRQTLYDLHRISPGARRPFLSDPLIRFCLTENLIGKEKLPWLPNQASPHTSSKSNLIPVFFSIKFRKTSPLPKFFLTASWYRTLWRKKVRTQNERF